jgi:hypothetical protein
MILPIFLITFIRMEAFLGIVDDFPNEMAKVHCMEQ